MSEAKKLDQRERKGWEGEGCSSNSRRPLFPREVALSTHRDTVTRKAQYGRSVIHLKGRRR